MRRQEPLAEPDPAGRGARPPRLLWVVNVPWFFVMHRLPIAQMARSQGIEVHVACGAGEGREDIEAAGIPFHSLPLSRRPWAPWSDLRSMAALVRLYRDLRPDAVHHVTLKPIVFGSIAARLTRVPAVINAFAGLGYAFSGVSRVQRWRRRALEWLIARALRFPRQRAVFENQDDCDLLVAAGAVARESCVTIPGIGVDTEVFSVSAEPPGPVRVLMAGRMTREKGLEVFVDAARRLRRRGIHARFQLVGRPDPDNPGSVSEGELERWNQEGVVEWLGFRRDMPQVVAGAHIVCLPTYYREGVPRVLLEGAACGRPLVTTDMPGCRDLVRDGVNGLIIPPRNAPALEAALEKLIADAALRARLGAAGRSLVMQRFALPGILEQFSALYRDVGLEARGA